jgi:hypothetical protein
MALVVVARFEGDKLAHEHLYWDQASALVQPGLLDPAGLPFVGAEGARSVTDRSIPSNALIHRSQADEIAIPNSLAQKRWVRLPKNRTLRPSAGNSFKPIVGCDYELQRVFSSWSLQPRSRQ